MYTQVGRPRVQFACASALAMLVEGHPEVCPLVVRHGGIAALASMLQTAGPQGMKAAAEALQVSSLRCPSVMFWAKHNKVHFSNSPGTVGWTGLKRSGRVSGLCKLLHERSHCDTVCS